MSLLSVNGLTIEVGGKLVCRELSFAVLPGQCWGLLGANGAGKTTLLHTLAGLRRPQAGEIRLLGEPLATIPRRQRAQLLGLLPQDSRDPLPATVLETVLIGRHPYLHAWQWESADDLAAARAVLAAVELLHAQQRQVDTLSGGERRRLALATLLLQSPRLQLLDEPANHLDLRHQLSLLELIHRRAIAADGALMLSLHDLNLAARFCDHLLLLFGDGAAMVAPTAEALTPANLKRLYGHPVRIIESGGRRAFVPD
ncbi:MAG TPA: ABC transporter ATP-binding protein [Gammaproteobacteria bacterium]|nr:ABC transporter ATP-binding protein [Gammaproteobacteria bacterium]